MATAGFGADVGVAAAAFVGTNVDNCTVTMAMVAGAPLHRAHRIGVGQVLGFAILVAVAVGTAAVLFEFSPAVVGLLGLVPLAIGLRGLAGLWRARARVAPGVGDDPPTPDVAPAAGDPPVPKLAVAAPRRRDGRARAEERAVGRSLTAGALVTIGAGGDNLAAYIPLFRVGGTAKLAAVAAVFVVGEALVTWLVLTGGRHPKARAGMTRLGTAAVPVLLCFVGVLVMTQAGTLSGL